MRVRDALVLLLAAGPAHGYQLKRDYERLTRSPPVNVGQIYQTLDRLARDGLAEREDAPAGERRVTYRLTAAGHDEARALVLDAPVPPGGHRSTVAGTVLLAMRVPGVDVLTVIDAHRRALVGAVQQVRRTTRGEDLDRAERLGVEAELAMTEAELRWLDLCEAELLGGT